MVFDPQSLLREQDQMLFDATPSEINRLHFLRARLSAQQRRTTQSNQWHKATARDGGRETAFHSSTTSSQQRGLHQGTLSQPPTDRPADTEVPPPRQQLQRQAVEGSEAMESSMSWGPGTRHGTGTRGYVPEHGSTAAAGLHAWESESLAGGSESRSAWGDSRRFSSVLDDMPASVDLRRSISESPALSLHHDGHPLPSASGSLRASTVMNTRRTTMATTSSLDDKPAVATGRPDTLGEAETAEVCLVPCDFCGRSFALDRVERHSVTCQKQRERDGGRPKTERLSLSIDTASRSMRQSIDSGVKSPGASQTWRRQSAQVRGAMSGSAAPLEDDRVMCPHCGRRFAAEAAARHMPLCKEKQTRAR